MPTNDIWLLDNAVSNLTAKLVLSAAAERRTGIQYFQALPPLKLYRVMMFVDWIFLKMRSLPPFRTNP